MMKNVKRVAAAWLLFACTCVCLDTGGAGTGVGFCGTAHGEDGLREAAIRAMAKATRFFRTEVATRGGYLWKYTSDLSMREGEGAATPSMIWVQPPGTPAVGMAFLEAYEATGDSVYLEAARDAARALVWGQLTSGGWDYAIDFDPKRSRRWYYRRDAEAGDTNQAERRNRTTLDDNTTQSALRLLMRADKALNVEDREIHPAPRRGGIHKAAMYALDALLKAQYPNGAWPQRYETFPDPEQFPVKQARYPKSWSRTYPEKRYFMLYTFNDGAISDVIETMIEAYHTYGDKRFLEAAKRGGRFLILAQMPDPQPAWAQQYNVDMEPAWARWFEPPAITGGESFRVMGTLMDLYLETGEQRYLEPIPRALAWAERSVLPDGHLARFYELKTNRPLYFTPDRRMTYDDENLRPGYSFKLPTYHLKSTEAYYKRIRKQGREAILRQRRERLARPSHGGRDSKVDPQQVRAVIEALDVRGRWIEHGALRDPENREKRIETSVISCRTFNRNLTLLAKYIKGNN